MKANSKECRQPQNLLGYRGAIQELEIVAGSVPSEVRPLAESVNPPDISLTDMAARAMHYLSHNPMEDSGYECRFDVALFDYPPSMQPATSDRPKSRDPQITFGDTECRMSRAFVLMREMSGSEEGRDAEEAIRTRILSYVRDDGLSWLSPYCLNCSDKPCEPCALNWTTGETLAGIVERSVRTGDRAPLTLARKLVDGLMNLAMWDTGRAYYPGGMGGWRDGEWFVTRYADNYPCILEPVVRYAEVTGDREVMDFAEAFADGMIADLQTNLGDNRIQSDGSFGGSNSHVHARAALGVLHLGARTQNSRYIEWARRVYDFLISQGTDWGWFPESIGRINSETCATGDMTEMASWLALAGYSRYWDDVERFVRNYIYQAQFFVTPAYEALYREVHKDRPEQAEDGIRLAHDFEGGFVARLTPNGLTMDSRMSMMGCCPPEGMRTLHISWRNVVTESPEGVFVNLSFNREVPQARIVSFAPDVGRLTVVVKKAGRFFLRPPSWALRTQVRAYRGTEEVEPLWKGDYIKFEEATEDEELTITYPVLRFKQKVEVGGQTYTYHWVGNTVTGVEPSSEGLPLFKNVLRPEIATQM